MSEEKSRDNTTRVEAQKSGRTKEALNSINKLDIQSDLEKLRSREVFQSN